MRAILVDDEALPLGQLKRVLENDVVGIEVIGAYLNPFEAEEMVKLHKPDIVFSDIEMPELNGLQLGERIQEVNPEIEIVFVTAFDQYAVQAFQLYAIDYIMKPIQLDRLQTTIERLRLMLSKQTEKAVGKKGTLEMRCFNSIEIQLPDGKVEIMNWRTAKAQELFAYLLHHRGQLIYRDTILEMLWPDFDLSRGSKQLYTTIYHIRQTLKKYGLDEVKISRQSLDNGYRLDLGTVCIDTEKWEEKTKKLMPLEYKTIDEHEQVLLAYKGDYLGEHDYVWAEAERERLRRLWLYHAERLQNFYIEQDMTSNALKVNEYIQQICPIEESSYFRLMKLYEALNNDMAVEAQYDKLSIIMEEQLDTVPSIEITEWYEIRNQKKMNNLK